MRASHPDSCSLPIPQKKTTIESIQSLTFTKGNVYRAEDSHVRHMHDTLLSSLAPPPVLTTLLKKSGEVLPLACLRQRPEFHLLAQACEPSDELFLHRVAKALFKVGFPDCSIASSLAQKLIDDHQHTMSDYHGSPLGSASTGNATSLRGQAFCCACGGICGIHSATATWKK